MSDSRQKSGLILAIVAGAVAGLIFKNFALGVGVFAAIFFILFFRIYVRYIKDNPKHYWFKAKLFGWGWTPASWQGWAVTGVYLVSIIFFAFTIDEASPASEVFFTFVLPITLLTIALIRIAYKTGEKPRWQWGPPKND
ncbi:MAG: hypothetical protein WD898_03095 [Candidatus Paceibacterota bacterium]